MLRTRRQQEEAVMYARVTWLEGSPSQAREAIAAMREQAIPAVQAAPGFSEILFLVDRDGGRALAVTLWETLEDLEDSEALAHRLRALPVARWSASGAERFEVALRHRAGAG
jgi:heme-degrading monooxygenase HmoA